MDRINRINKIKINIKTTTRFRFLVLI